MKLDKKFAIVRLKELPADALKSPEALAAAIAANPSVLEIPDETAPEFFVLRLKDANAAGALSQYAREIRQSDPEFADAVKNLADLSMHFPGRKQPD
jgi:hypothetical protein